MSAVVAFNESSNLPFRKVTPEFLKSFEAYLRGRNCSWNTVSTYMRTLRAVYNRAVDRRIAPYVPHHSGMSIRGHVPIKSVHWKKRIWNVL